MRREFACITGILVVLGCLSASVMATDSPASEPLQTTVASETVTSESITSETGATEPAPITTVPIETTATVMKMYLVINENAQTYANVDGAYLALAGILSKDTEVQGYAPLDGYIKTTTGVFLKESDVSEVIPPSAAPVAEKAIEPLPEKKDMTATWIMLILIFLGCLFGTGAIGYFIRGRIEKKRWENDPFRFDNPAKEPINGASNEDTDVVSEQVKSAAVSGKKRTVLDRMREDRKAGKTRKESPASSKVQEDPRSRWINGGVDEKGRTYYYEPEDIDPEGDPFFVDENGQKKYYKNLV